MWNLTPPGKNSQLCLGEKYYVTKGEGKMPNRNIPKTDSESLNKAQYNITPYYLLAGCLKEITQETQERDSYKRLKINELSYCVTSLEI